MIPAIPQRRSVVQKPVLVTTEKARATVPRIASLPAVAAANASYIRVSSSVACRCPIPLARMVRVPFGECYLIEDAVDAPAFQVLAIEDSAMDLAPHIDRRFYALASVCRDS